MNKNYRNYGRIKPIAYYNLAGGMARHNFHVVAIIVLGVVLLFGALAALAGIIHA
jgi:hypothetical protein